MSDQSPIQRIPYSTEDLQAEIRRRQDSCRADIGPSYTTKPNTKPNSYLLYHGDVLNEQGSDIAQIEAIAGGQLGPPYIELSFRLQSVGSIQLRLSTTEATELARHLRQAIERSGKHV